ncbi:hypothetical protein GCM10010236_74040 [Streptomyces eurythermus]|nr:hypothetical protein GCM10010236_74040 [Streptomyces eurythermus]
MGVVRASRSAVLLRLSAVERPCGVSALAQGGVFSVAAIGAGVAPGVWRVVIGTASGVSSTLRAGQ